MWYLVIVLAMILVAGCAGPTGGLLPDVTDKTMKKLDAQCFRDHMPPGYWESQFVDEFAVATTCHTWARRQVSGAH